MLRLLFYFALACLSLGQFSKIIELNSVSVYLFDIAVIAFGLIGTIHFLITKRFSISKNLILFFCFSFIAFISLIIQASNLIPAEMLQAGFYLVRWVFYLLSANVVFNLVKANILTKQQLLQAFLFSGVFIALSGFVQLILLPDFTLLDPTLGWDPHQNRLASTFFDPNFAGGYLVLVFSVVLLNRKSLTSKGISFYLLMLLLAIFFTYSRSAWGMFAVIIFIYGVARSPKVLILSLILAFCAYFAVPRIQTRFSGITDPADSASLRLSSWQNAYTIAKDNLLVGVGFNAFKKAQVDYGFLDPDTQDEHHTSGADSSMLLVFATTGIFGLLLFLLGYVFPMVNNASLTVTVVLIGLALQSQFINALFYPQIMFLWLTVLAVDT